MFFCLHLRIRDPYLNLYLPATGIVGGGLKKIQIDGMNLDYVFINQLHTLNGSYIPYIPYNLVGG